jgi:hypothetical protein
MLVQRLKPGMGWIVPGSVTTDREANPQTGSAIATCCGCYGMIENWRTLHAAEAHDGQSGKRLKEAED